MERHRAGRPIFVGTCLFNDLGDLAQLHPRIGVLATALIVETEITQHALTPFIEHIFSNEKRFISVLKVTNHPEDFRQDFAELQPTPVSAWPSHCTKWMHDHIQNTILDEDDLCHRLVGNLLVPSAGLVCGPYWDDGQPYRWKS